MIIVSTEQIPGKRATKTLGLVRGGTVRAKHLGKDVLALFRNFVGGEIPEYTKILAESREQALDRMTQDARRLGANAIVGMRFCSSEISSGAAEVFVYGTAVYIVDDPKNEGQ